MKTAYRNEHDLLSPRLVPDDAYYGVHTLRARENFAISGAILGSYPDLVNALAVIKQACALASGSGIVHLVLAKGWLDQAQLDIILRPDMLTQPRLSSQPQ